jgi:hypothetical protein
VELGDVLSVASALTGQCDAVLLDVDNGPDFLVHPHNASVYTDSGMAVLFDALRDQGRLAIWSSTPAAELRTRLEERFQHVSVHELPVTRNGRTLTYFVLVAVR